MSSPTPDRSGGGALAGAYWDMLRSIAWTLSSRWGIRIIGIVSTVIMARLLTPADFGIVAMATMVGGLLDNLSRMGIVMLVIRERDASREFYDSAWTMQIVQGIFVAGMLAALSPLAAIYFDEARVVPVMQVLALSALLGGTLNIGLVLFRKELKFSKDFQFQIAKRLITFVATITLAFLWRSYWAIVIGRLIAQVSGIALSFWMHPYRPRVSFARARDFVQFAKSVIPYNVGYFLGGRGDVLVVGRFAGTAALGVYNVSHELAGTFTREVVGTIGRGLLPNYAKLASDRERLVEAFLTVLAVTASLATALGLGLVAVAPEFVTVLLGEQWADAAPVVRWLAVYGTIVCLLETGSGHILIVVGKERLSAVLMWCRIGALLPLTVLAAAQGSPEAVAMAAAASAALVSPIVGVALSRSLGVPMWRLLAALWRPAGAAAAMLAAVSAVPELAAPVVVALLVKVAAGGVVYVSSLVLLWLAVGRPPGPERLVVDFLRDSLWTKLRRPSRVDHETRR